MTAQLDLKYEAGKTSEVFLFYNKKLDTVE
jgi:hypothetical protein